MNELFVALTLGLLIETNQAFVVNVTKYRDSYYRCLSMLPMHAIAKADFSIDSKKIIE